MQLLKNHQHRRMPWKNGGGVTVEIAVFPADASVDNFDWRISTATVASDGPFSVFTGIDRTLSVLEGDGIILSVEGLDDQELKGETPPFSFPADSPTSAKLLGSAITDLNVMTRRGRFTHQVSRHQISAETAVSLSGATVLVFCSSGTVQAGEIQLEVNDCLRCEQCSNAELQLSGSGTVFVIALNPV
ncbi:HutD family protein [Pseudochrobactrum sp. B5]|uniref:HutD/Ves family protein n=1 Tax=Pseudochrobactrum sp. B5 TaxID=1289478 RepID=UPI000950FE75|nr:HutD family protein [Pseudochrobactrum sp. B5]